MPSAAVLCVNSPRSTHAPAPRRCRGAGRSGHAGRVRGGQAQCSARRFLDPDSGRPATSVNDSTRRGAACRGRRGGRPRGPALHCQRRAGPCYHAGPAREGPGPTRTRVPGSNRQYRPLMTDRVSEALTNRARSPAPECSATRRSRGYLELTGCVRQGRHVVTADSLAPEQFLQRARPFQRAASACDPSSSMIDSRMAEPVDMRRAARTARARAREAGTSAALQLRTPRAARRRCGPMRLACLGQSYCPPRVARTASADTSGRALVRSQRRTGRRRCARATWPPAVAPCGRPVGEGAACYRRRGPGVRGVGRSTARRRPGVRAGRVEPACGQSNVDGESVKAGPLAGIEDSAASAPRRSFGRAAVVPGRSAQVRRPRTRRGSHGGRRGTFRWPSGRASSK